MLTIPPYLVAIIIIVFSIISLPMSYLALRSSGLKVGFKDALYLGAVQIVVSLFFGYIGNLISVSLASVVSYVSILFSVALWVFFLRRMVKENYSGIRAAVAYLLYFTYSILAAVVVAFITIPFFAQAYKITSESMSPALKNNDMVILFKINKSPSNNEIIVYKKADGAQVIGRVKGQPNSTVTVEGGKVEIGGTVRNETSEKLDASQYYVTVDNAASNIPPRVISKSSIVGEVGSKL